ncbi:head decoration protein [Methylobacterium sp. WCS2018Hpa-22]|uniref:head decoration protein n=1 Tax=Methylobacterium sp. WCS2018Hpa-22 TaxID=3073633 RepID=UPI00288B3396|nr:head decoration protein [Methylobacterium sp. WCS2018Hpa-22]
MSANAQIEGTFVPDNLVIKGGLARKVTIKSGAGILPRGTVLGKVTADREYLKSVAAATDGSQTPDAILSEPVDATSGDVEAIVYITGHYNLSALAIGAGHTAASIDDAFRGKSIFIETTVPHP